MYPVRGQRLALLLTGPQIELIATGDRQHLQPASRRKLAALFRNEAVETSGVGVFGFVNEAGLRIHGDGFVHEPAHRFERLCLHASICFG